MKQVKWLIVLVSILPLFQVQAQHELESDTTELDKQRVSRELIVVRDSLNSFTANLAQKSESVETAGMSRRRLNRAISELAYQRAEIDAVIEEVAALQTGKWNRALRDRSIRVVRDVRKNIKKVREDVKGLATARA